MIARRAVLLSLVGLLLGLPVWATDNTPPEGFVSLFNGKDLLGWKAPAGDNGHWKVVDGVIDYDAQSEAQGDKSLWSDREYGDFILHVDWRLKEAPFLNKNVPTSYRTAPMRATFMAGRCGWRCRTRIPASSCAAMEGFRSTSGVGLSAGRPKKSGGDANRTSHIRH